MATQYLNCASAAADVSTFWGGSSGTVTADSSVVRITNFRSYKLNTSTGPTLAQVFASGVLANAGRRISFWVRFPSVAPSANTTFALTATSAGTATGFSIQLRTDGKLSLTPVGLSAVTGSTTLVANAWYRVDLSYTISSTTSWRAKVWIEKEGTGVVSLDNDLNSTGTITSGTLDRLYFQANTNAGSSWIMYVDEVVVDNGTDYNDIGLANGIVSVGVTAKLPNANSTNTFNSFGGANPSNRWQNVNERPRSTTNYWRNTVVTQNIENYGIETASAGDVDISGKTIIARCSWTWANLGTGGGAQTASIYDNASATSATFALSASSAGGALTTLITDSSSYPSNPACGMKGASGGVDSFLSECGVLFAYGSPKYTGTIGITLGGATCSVAATFTKPTYHGSAAITAGPATASIVATFTKPTYHASAAVTAKGATCSAAATFSPGTKTATAAVTAGPAAASATATFVKPTYHGSAAVTTGPASASAAATFSPGTKTASAAVTTAGATAAASATFTKPTFAATSIVTVAPASASASATFTKPTYSATAALAAGVVICAALASVTNPTYAAEMAVTTGPATCTATAVFANAIYTAHATITTGPVTAIASATFQKPTYSASAAITVPPATCSVSATFAKPVYSASAALTNGPASAVVFATFTKPTYSASVAVTTGPASASIAAAFTKPTYSGSASLTTGPAACSAFATFTRPTYSASVTGTTGGATCAASATFSGATAYICTANVTTGPATAAGLATFTPPDFVPGGWSVLAIESSFYEFFAGAFSASPYHVDAEPFDPEGRESWVQIDFQTVSSPAIRKSPDARDELRVSIVAHCWARLTSDNFAGSALADRLCDILHQAIIPVQDFQTVGEPEVGTLLLWEPQQTDVTDIDDADIRADWQHVMVTIDGRAQQK